MAQQKINDMETENKENARFFAHQLIEAQDETKALCEDLEELTRGTKGGKRQMNKNQDQIQTN